MKRENDPQSARYLEAILGWPAQATGADYKVHYLNHDDPMQAYVTDKMIHEIGHVLFLHGITDVKNEEDLWFSLGLGWHHLLVRLTEID